MAKTINSIFDLETFLAGMKLDHTPTVHINGRDHPTAVITVDFGAPLEPPKITNEQTSELSAHLRRCTKDIIGRDNITVRVNSDTFNGLLVWSSIY